MTKTASKLAQIARANKEQQEKVQLIKNGIVVFIGTKADADSFINENGGTYTIKKWNPNHLQNKVAWASHQHVRNIKKYCYSLAKQGFGSVHIKLDKTFDLFQIDENRGSTYSAKFVEKLLNQEGFTLDLQDDCYDAISSLLIWDDTLPTAPLSQRINMKF